jgi:hypothetical protein
MKYYKYMLCCVCLKSVYVRSSHRPCNSFSSFRINRRLTARVARELILQPARTILDTSLRPSRRSHRGELHNTTVTHLELMVLLGVESLLLFLVNDTIVVDMCVLLSENGLTLYTIESFIPAKEKF